MGKRLKLKGEALRRIILSASKLRCSRQTPAQNVEEVNGDNKAGCREEVSDCMLAIAHNLV
jgi:hypothetical protein